MIDSEDDETLSGATDEPGKAKQWEDEITPEDLETVLKVFEWEVMPECLMVTGNTPRMIRIALDSGAGDHVVGPEDVQGLTIEESAGSKAGRHFMAANKQRACRRQRACNKRRALCSKRVRHWQIREKKWNQ